MSLNQTLQEKFPHLELSVLKLSKVQRDNETKRIDSEFFKKEYLENERLLSHSKILAEISNTYELHSNGAFKDIYDIIHDNNPKTIPYIESKNIGDCFIEGETDRISEVAHNLLAKTITRQGDILTARTGKIGGASYIFKEWENCNTNQNIVNIRIFDNEFNKLFVLVFLNSKFGTYQFERASTGNVQPWLNLTLLRKIKIPLLPMPFQLEIEKMVKDSHFALEQSKVLYKQAEELLYTELGLDPTNPMQSILSYKPILSSDCYDSTNIESHNDRLNYSIHTLKESFLKTGRLDSEYYQVKYEEIESFIQSYQGGFSKLEIMEIKDSNFTPKDKEKYRYIELANIGANGNISAPLEELGEDLPTRARRLVKEGDLIISSVEGSLGSCALITKEFHHCIVSTGFYVLKSHSINSETLLVLFKSQFFQDYLKKFPSGTILSAISKEELQNILIPKINPNTQDSIASHIQKSFTLRAEAKALLNEAKAKVESAISGGGGG